MNQYEKEIQALKYRCRKLEQQCSMFDDTFQKQNQLVKSQDDMIQILKERNHYLEEHIATLTKVLLIFQFVTNQICSRVTDLLSFVSLSFLCNPADFLPDHLFHLQCYI